MSGPSPPPPAAVKICGVTRPQDAMLAADLGARFVGLNFFQASPRCVDLGRAVEIADAVRSRVRLVGVFVNASTEVVENVASKVGLDLLQFHGEEDPKMVAAFGARAIKVFRIREPLQPELLEDYPRVWGYLFDCPHAGLYGGTGQSWNFDLVAGVSSQKPTLVAGGIGPNNVRAALQQSGAYGVDVCSGVESSPGIKDPVLLQHLFKEVCGGQGGNAS